jgi:SH3-like domain-containing protein
MTRSPAPGRLVGALLAAGLLAGLFTAAPARAEFRSVAEASAILYDAPSTAAVPMVIVSRSYPLEIISTTDAWVKVKDHTGALAWIERRLLAARRMVLVTAPRAEVLQRAEEGAPVAFAVAQNVVLDLIEIAPGGWLRVRHADGASGFLRATFAWGD